MVHFGESHQKQVYCIQHQLNTHKNNDGIASCQYPNNTNAEQGQTEVDIILYRHFIFLVLKAKAGSLGRKAVYFLGEACSFLFFINLFFQ
jgi:hypothetical protein